MLRNRKKSLPAKFDGEPLDKVIEELRPESSGRGLRFSTYSINS